MVDQALFSSDRMDWGTPEAFYNRLDCEFAFTLDPCATAQNAKCARFYTPEIDGLGQPWPGTVFVNPPYGREIGDWVRKAYQEAQAGATVVMLIPARTDTAYWHDWIMRASEVRFVRGRLTFEGASNSAPFPSCVVVFRPGCEGPPTLGAMPAKDAPLFRVKETVDQKDNVTLNRGNGARPAGVPAGAWLEEKEINGCGPYRYWRWIEGGRRRAQYAGKAGQAKGKT